VIKTLLIVLYSSLLIASDSLPEWVLSPQYGAVGSGTSERMALLQAKAELARQKRLHITSEAIRNDSDFSTHSTQRANEKIYTTIVKEQFIDDDGTVYVWVVEE